MNLGVTHPNEFLSDRWPRIVWCQLRWWVGEEHMISFLLIKIKLLILIGAKIQQDLVIQQEMFVG